MNNIQFVDGRITFNEKCTMCYRCFSHCPKKAITIIRKKVIEQSKYENYRQDEQVKKSTLENIDKISTFCI